MQGVGGGDRRNEISQILTILEVDVYYMALCTLCV